MKEIIRKIHHQFKSEYDLIFVAKPNCNEVAFYAATSDILNLLQKYSLTTLC